MAEEYCYPYAAKLCGALSVMNGIDFILSCFPYPSKAFDLKIRSDYQSVLHSLWNTSLVIILNAHLHQVVREIGLIREKWSVNIMSIKIVAY